MSAVTTEWDDEVHNFLPYQMLVKIITGAFQMEPSHGDWCVDGQDVTLWENANSLAASVVIENSRSIAEDASWL